MTGPEHYREAERLLGLVADNWSRTAHAAAAQAVSAEAQVHATLALAAAFGTYGVADETRTNDDFLAWERVAGEYTAKFERARQARAAEREAEEADEQLGREIDAAVESTGHLPGHLDAMFAEPVAGRDFDEMPEATIVPRSLAEIQAIEAAEHQQFVTVSCERDGCPVTSKVEPGHSLYCHEHVGDLLGDDDPFDEMTIADVMTAEEMDVDGTDAQFRLDADDYAESLEQWDAQRGEV